MSLTFPRKLSVEDISAIAHGDRVTVSADAWNTLEAFHSAANEISKNEAVYGRTTGVGANRLTKSDGNGTAHGMNLLRSHAVDAGPAVDRTVTRAMLAVRLNQLLHPGSGIEVAVVQALASMLEADSLPEIRKYGGIGTADLPALASTALALVGERATSGGEFEPIGPIHADSALPFMSSSALTIGGTALTAARLKELLSATLAVFAFSAFAARANPEGFSRQAADAIGSPCSAENARKLNVLLGDLGWKPMRIQDPFAYRGFLPSVSVLAMSIERLSDAVENLASRSQENPRFFAEHGKVVHHGAFLENWLAHELDSTAMALAQVAPQILGRIRFLNDDTISGLPRFLAPEQAGASGTMVIEYVAASAMGEVFAAANPVSTQTAVLSCGVEEDATFAPSSLSQLERATEGLEIMLGCELLTSVRALRLREEIEGLDLEAASPEFARLLTIADELPRGFSDRDLRPDLEIARTLIGRFARWSEVSRTEG